jgi:GNAT superfamily N-acetyltransferase
VARVSIEPDGKTGEMAFVVGDMWQNMGLGTKMVDYALDIAKEMGVEGVFAIMLQDNYRALSLTKKMGFDIEYLNDGTVKGSLNLKENLPDNCLVQKNLTQTIIEPPARQGRKEILEVPKQGEHQESKRAKAEVATS